MQLTNFITIDPAKIAGGAAIQATEADAFRQNGLLFHNIMQSLLTCPFLPNGVDGDDRNDPAIPQQPESTSETR